MSSRRVCVLAAGVAFLAGCGGSTPTGPTAPSPAPAAFASHASAHFAFRYAPLDAASVAATAAAVEAHHARILGDLGLDEMPAVTVLGVDQTRFVSQWMEYLERRYGL